MARINLWTEYKVPRGVYIHLSYQECCDIMGAPVNYIKGLLGVSAVAKPWIGLIALAIAIQQNWIQHKNERSNKQGVRLKFDFLAGVITGIKRKGKSPSGQSDPCGTTQPGHNQTNYTVDTSQQLTAANIETIVENAQILINLGRNPVIDPDPTPAERSTFRNSHPNAATERLRVFLPGDYRDLMRSRNP